MAQTRSSLYHRPQGGSHPKAAPVPMALRMIRLLFRFGGPLAPKTMGRLGYRLWFTPRRTRIPAYEREWLAGADESLSLVHEGREVAVHAWGSGPVVLLVHGWEGRGSQLGAFVNPLVDRGFRVVSFDAPGHGASTGRQTDAAEVARILSKLVAREGGIFGVIGHSFGSMVIGYALSQGVEVARAALISPPARLDILRRFFCEQLHIPASVWPELQRRVEARFPDLGPRVWECFSTENNAREFAFPGLVVHDRKDPLIPFSQGQRVHQSWKGSRLVETRGLGHHRILRDTEVVREVADFMDRSAISRSTEETEKKPDSKIA